MAEFTGREMHSIRRALAIATIAVERVTERSHSGDAGMKALLVKLVESDVELVMYAREARIALTREPEPAQALSARRHRRRGRGLAGTHGCQGRGLPAIAAGMSAGRRSPARATPKLVTHRARRRAAGATGVRRFSLLISIARPA